MNLKNTDKILVLASASTGNNVFCTPAIRFLRKHLPSATIDVVALNKLSAEVFAGNHDINNVYVINSASAFDKKAKDYSQVIVLNKNALKKLAGIKTVVIQPPTLHGNEHHADQLLNFIASLVDGKIQESDREYVIASDESSQQFLAQNLAGVKKNLILIHLGCGTTLLHGWKFFYSRRADDEKLWPIGAYIELGKALQNAIPDLSIIITGTSNESFLAKKFKKEVPNTIDLVGKTTVMDLAALMTRINLFIAHDCGVIHIAAASNVPIVALFGPTNQVMTGPYPLRAQHHVIKKDRMTEISVMEVANIVTHTFEKQSHFASE